MATPPVAGSIPFFTGLAAEAWTRAKEADATAAEAGYLVSRLGLTGPARLLDVPCGRGRLAHAIAAMGHRVTGVDGSEEMLRHARAGAGDCSWLRGDMAGLAGCLDGAAAFDGAWCFGNAIGYLDRTATAEFFAGVAGALKPNARFVIDTEMTAESVLPNLADRLWQQIGDILMVVEHRYDAARSLLVSDYRFVRGAEVQEGRLSHVIFTAGALVELLAAAALDVAAMEADLDGTPFGLGDHRLLVTAVRR